MRKYLGLLILLVPVSASAGVARFTAKRVVEPPARMSGRFVAEVAKGEASLGKFVAVKSARAVKAGAVTTARIVW